MPDDLHTPLSPSWVPWEEVEIKPVQFLDCWVSVKIVINAKETFFIYQEKYLFFLRLTKLHIFNVMVFPLVKYRCEIWTIKKAECWRMDAFELWCWRRLKSPLDCKEIQSVSPKGNQLYDDAEAEAPIFWPHDAKSWLTGNDPDAGKDWRQKKKRGWQRMRWLDSITDSTDMNFSDLWEIVKGRVAWYAAVHGVAKSQTQLSDSTTRAE